MRFTNEIRIQIKKSVLFADYRKKIIIKWKTENNLPLNQALMSTNYNFNEIIVKFCL